MKSLCDVNEESSKNVIRVAVVDGRLMEQSISDAPSMATSSMRQNKAKERKNFVKRAANFFTYFFSRKMILSE